MANVLSMTELSNIIFTWNSGNKFSNKLFKFVEHSYHKYDYEAIAIPDTQDAIKETLDYENAVTAGHSCVQVARNVLYLYHWHSGGISELSLLEDKSKYILTQRREAPRARFAPSMALVYKKFIFMIGGYKVNHLDSVDVFDIGNNRWSKAPPLQEARYYHSSCVLNSQIIYTFGGSNANGSFLQSMEFLDCAALVAGGLNSGASRW